MIKNLRHLRHLWIPILAACFTIQGKNREISADDADEILILRG